MLLTDKLSSFNKRVVRQYSPFFVSSILLSVFFSSATLAADIFLKDIDEVKAIAKSGAVSLALQSIDSQQPVFDLAKPNVWLAWERTRLAIYQSGQRWQSLQDRIADYKYKLPDDFYFLAKQQQVDALLKLKKGPQARQILQNLIWSKKEEGELDAKIKKKWLPVWRKRVIQSYLVNTDKEDALLAAQRYYQDYHGNHLEDRLLRARILLINQREDEVVDLLKGDTQHPQAAMLYLLAQLRSKNKSAENILKSALRKIRSKTTTARLKFMLWAVVAEAAKKNIDRAMMANAFEHVLAGYKKTELPIGLFDFSADTLWDAYIDYALYLGNSQQYLIGDDRQWLTAAIRAEKKYKIKARSLYALVILRGQNEEARLQAANGFLNLMQKRKRGAQLIKKLFLKSTYFKDINSIPAPIRYDLVNIALSRSNIELASNLMTTIEAAPIGIDDYRWQLQRARIFVLGGKPEEVSKALIRLLKKHKTLTKMQSDRFLQVLFDLQTIKEHQRAYTLFEIILEKISNEKSKREIAFWMADSLKSLHQYVEAAKLYLHSATYNKNKGFDPWGQTARYQAAEMLIKANLLQDAYAVYKNLLAVTKDPTRRAVLKHELQKLWLFKVLNKNRVVPAS